MTSVAREALRRLRRVPRPPALTVLLVWIAYWARSSSAGGRLVMPEQAIVFHTRRPEPGGAVPASRIAALGRFLRRNRRAIIAVQWCVVVFYAALVVIPAFMPLPPESAHLWDNLRLFAQFMFWGVWWPG